MKIIDCEQYSERWFKERLSIPTASMFSHIVTSTGKKASSFEQCAFEKAAEIKSGEPENSEPTEWMKRGTEMEATARAMYEIETRYSVIEVGMIKNDAGTCSCSPDGLIPIKYCPAVSSSPLFIGGLEIKCPKQSTQMKYLYKKELPLEYRPQVWGSLWVADEVGWWDFYSYHPKMDSFRIGVTRESKGYKEYAEALDKYMPEFVKLVAKIVEET
jgi:hypothetical protein